MSLMNNFKVSSALGLMALVAARAVGPGAERCQCSGRFVCFFTGGKASVNLGRFKISFGNERLVNWDVN